MVKWFARLGLRTKIVLVIAAITCTMLLLASAIQLLYQHTAYQRRAVAEQQVLAQLIADRSTAALSFADAVVARENLAALGVNAAILNACIYDADDRLFAGYDRTADSGPGCAPGLLARPPGIAHGELFTATLIHIDGERIGTLTILSSLADLSARIRTDLLVALAILLVAAGLAILAALRLQRLVSDPVIHLAETAALITRSGDYQVRAEASTGDEVGQLVRAFNGMLDALHERDASLRDSIERLRDEVARRQVAEAEATAAYAQLQQAFEKAVQIEKLSALGSFVGGIAHEINNPLMGLTNYISHVQERTDNPEHAALLGKAQGQVRRIGRIVKRVLRYARTGSAFIQSIDLQALAADACLLLKPELERWSIDVAIQSETPTPRVVSDKDVLDQALVNLLLNAVYAVKGEARREIRVRIASAPGGTALTVEDTGPGVPAAMRSQIYDPFFTTKPPGDGTGLGLSVTMRGLSEVGATLTLDETYQDGARFVILLPDEAPKAQS